MGQSLARLIQSTVNTIWPLAMNIWDAWGIQLLVLASFFCQISLVHFGGRRRYSSALWIRLLIALGNIATIALGKLTVVTIQNPQNPEYSVELQGLLAPLLLMHLGYPDSISTYSVEDTHMETRHALNLLIQLGLVIWILTRCFDPSSPISMLYIPLFIAGIIEPVATIFTLASVYDDSTSVHELKRIEPLIGKKGRMPGTLGFGHYLKPILVAYHRFNCLQPHQVNWIYHSSFVEKNWMSVDELTPKEAFDITEIELGFVYDAIYTQSPIVYTKRGLVSRVISISCLVSTLCGFSVIFRSAFLLDAYVTYTYAILIGSIIMELYQIFKLPFSYSAIIALWEWSQSLRQRWRCKYYIYVILDILVGVCKGQKMWSNSLGQLNLMEYYLKSDFSKPISHILSKIDKEEKIKKYWRSTDRVTIDSNLKGTIVKTMKKLGQITPKDFDDNIRLRTLEVFQIPTNNIKTRIENPYKNREFDKCIIIWHIATDNLLSSLNLDDSTSSSMINPWEVSKLLSNYMMYLLMDRPYMLSLTTGDIILGYASSTIKALVDQIPSSFDKKSQKTILRFMMDNQVRVHDNDGYKTFITREWDVLEDVKQLVEGLKNLDNDVMWELISSMWIELLCYAASKSQVYQHVRMLREGGELITHVWLLLLHKVDKFPRLKIGLT